MKRIRRRTKVRQGAFRRKVIKNALKRGHFSLCIICQGFALKPIKGPFLKKRPFKIPKKL
jgi:hypothetical protein